MFDRLIHADWSINPVKRWAASATHKDGRWQIATPLPVGAVPRFLADAFTVGEKERVLLGFDFPIGLPSAYGALTGFASFQEALPALGSREPWAGFFDVCERGEDVSLYRPFYPQVSRKGASPASLVSGIGIGDTGKLLRICERRTAARQAACCLFWTLGGNQVGKAAIAGWREVIRPALAQGAKLWPFEGPLAELGAQPGVVLAETYPAEIYAMVGARFLPGESKRQPADRARKAPALFKWAEQHAVVFSTHLMSTVADGFGTSATGEDMYDAFLGLLGMIEVAEGRRAEMTETHAAVLNWEGWILGR